MLLVFGPAPLFIPGLPRTVAVTIGLFAAVPAVLLYNFLVRRNKVIGEKFRGFAGDLQTYLISKGSK